MPDGTAAGDLDSALPVRAQSPSSGGAVVLSPESSGGTHPMLAHRTRLAAAARCRPRARRTADRRLDRPTPASRRHRTVTIKGIEPNPGRFFAKGKVIPQYAERGAIMQRKLPQPVPVARRLPLRDQRPPAATASASSRCGASARSATA